MKNFLFFFLYFFSFYSIYGTQEYTEPQDVATTEGLPSSLVNQSVCVISGEYTDSVLDVVIPGPEPLIINRIYNSFSKEKPWSDNHYDSMLIANVNYQGTPSYLISLRQPSNAQLDYVFEKKGDYLKLKEVPFKLIVPKGLTNGASRLSGKTNVKNQTLHFYPDEESIVTQSGNGSRKIFKQMGTSLDERPFWAQISEEKANGSRIYYKGKMIGGHGTSEIICENKENKKRYGSVKFTHKSLGNDLHLRTLITSDGRELNYFIKHHHYKVTHKEKFSEYTYPVDRYYLTKVEHPYAPHEKYSYQEKALSRDLNLIAKVRNGGRQFMKIDYYYKGTNLLGENIGNIHIADKDDFRLDRVKRLQAPVGTDATPITTHRFDYHATILKHKTLGHKKVGKGYTDVYDAANHKTRYVYDENHRLTSIVRYLGTSSYVPYTEERFFWDKDGCLTAKIFRDGKGHIHHARTFAYDSYGNVLTSTLCGKLTGLPCAPILLDSKGRLVENGYERETKTYTYSQDGLNLLLSETDSMGKTIHYKYKNKSDRLKAKYVSYEGKIRLREFYFYDCQGALEKKILDDGCHEPYDDLCDCTERHYTLMTPRTEAPVGLHESVEEWVFDFQTQHKTFLKRSDYTYSAEGRLLKQDIFDANQLLAYTLQWEYDLHGNLISETNALGETLKKSYDLANDQLIKQKTSDFKIVNSYDFANRLIEQTEVHANQKFVTSHRFDYLGNCLSTRNPYGHETQQSFDDFGRVVEIGYPQVLTKKGVLKTPIVKKSYDIAGFPISLTQPNGEAISIEVNIRGQPTQITYPDGTTETMIYSLSGQLMQKIAKNGTRTEYIRDPLGRVTQESTYGETPKHTFHHYQAFHLKESVDPEGHVTSYAYDAAGRLKEMVKNDQKTQQAYDALGRLCEIKEYYGYEPHEYRTTIKKYDLLDRIIEESLQTADGQILHFSCFAYDNRGNQILAQTGDQKIITEYNTRDEPTKIIDAMGHETHIEYDHHFMNSHGQRVLQKRTTDPLGYQTLDVYDTANRLAETIRLNPLGIKVSRKLMVYDFLGNPTKIEEEVIEQGTTIRTLTTLFFYQATGQLTQTIEAAETPEQKITRISYNAFGQKEILTKPDGNEIHYTYDAFGRLKTQSSSDQSISYRYEYNLLDQVIGVVDQNSGKTTQRNYFQENLIKETLANGLSVDYTYDRTGRACQLTFPDQTGVEYVYHAVDLKEIHRLIHGQRIYSHKDLEHSLAGQITKTQPPGHNGCTTYHFDPLGHCVSIESAAFNQKVPCDGFDLAGNLLKFELQNTRYEFTYDDLYQIQTEKGHCTHTYSFDSLFNCTSKDGEKYQHNALNQLIQKGEQTLVYDLNGNLIRKGLEEYSYDALNRLVKIASKDRVITYSYDAFDRRITKTVNGEEELFLYQGMDEVGRWKNAQCQEMRLIGKNPQSLTAALEVKGAAYVPLHDISGNITALFNLQGELIEQYRYSIYGEREILSPSGEKHMQSLIGNPWQYASKRMDEESGFIAFGIRDYDPQLGRWINPDPAGFVDGSNLYAYVHNNSLQHFDRLGMFTELVWGVATGIKRMYNNAETDYQKLCIPLGWGQCYDPCSTNNVWHVNIEDGLEERYNFRKKESDPLFHRTKTYCANDFINPLTGKNYDFKEMPAGKYALFINGIDNNIEDFKKSVLHIARITGYNIHGVFCPTFGKTIDALCYKHALQDFIGYEGVRELQKNIQHFDAHNPIGATMLLIPHSRGAGYTRNCMIDSTQAQRNRVHIRAFAPGVYIERQLCKSITHYESTKDIVPHLDWSGRQRCQDTIIKLKPHKSTSYWSMDHEFTSRTYEDTLKVEVEKYMQGN